MSHEEDGRFWNANAETWTKLARAGYDVYRDHLNTPAFLVPMSIITHALIGWTLDRIGPDGSPARKSPQDCGTRVWLPT